MNCLGHCQQHRNPKPPHALPEYGLLRWGRLLCALLVIFVTLRLAPCGEEWNNLCDNDVSHVTHSFGALSGLLAGLIFLKVRHFKKHTRVFRNILLCVYFFMVSGVIIQFLLERFGTDKEHLPWSKYESMCQHQCYEYEKNSNCTVTLCNPSC